MMIILLTIKDITSSQLWFLIDQKADKKHIYKWNWLRFQILQKYYLTKDNNLSHYITIPQIFLLRVCQAFT